jgi:hypothetical protein
MMKIWTILAALFLVTMSTGPLMAQPAQQQECILKMDTASSNWIIRGFDPFDQNLPTGTFEITFRNEGGRACVFQPVVVLDGESFGLANGSAPKITYTLLDVTRNVNITPFSGQSPQRGSRGQITIKPRSQELYRFRLAIVDDTIVGDGLFTQNVRFEAADPRDMIVGGRSLTLGLDILPSARMTLSGAFRRNGGQALVDLGVLEDSLVSLPLQLHVQSTRGYKLDFESENRGKLRLEETEWTVDYALGLDGQTLPLSKPYSHIAPRPSGPLDRLPLSFYVSGTTGKRAGIYSDTIVVSVSAY